MAHRFDRRVEDVGNVVSLEHVNTQIPDQQLATLFYISGLGLTRDPFLMTGVDNMWANVGSSQFHLPTGKQQVLRGATGLVLPEREALLGRLAAVRKPLEGTLFSFQERDDHVEAICPWGNRIRCHEPAPRFGRVALGLPYVELSVPVGAAAAIARFYREILGAPARVEQDGGVPRAIVPVGPDQDLIFRESEMPQPEFDGHHVQIYLQDFSGPYGRLLERGLISQEDDQHQYRFINIVDVDSNRPVFAIEHEVRSMRHPLYARPLVNRNPAQTYTNYMRGHDSWRGPYIPE